jgi:hypothetical protein
VAQGRGVPQVLTIEAQDSVLEAIPQADRGIFLI